MKGAILILDHIGFSTLTGHGNCEGSRAKCQRFHVTEGAFRTTLVRQVLAGGGVEAAIATVL